jgi:hypothetical protein
MTRRRLGLLVATLAISMASVAAAQPKELLALKGQPVQPVIDKLGPPESQVAGANGATTYVWVVKSMVNMPTRVQRTEYSNGIANTYETMELRPQLTPCTLTLVVDGTGTITESDPRGQFPACAAIADKLLGKN